MTREHAYPNWVLNLLPGEKAGTTFYMSPKLPELLRAWFTKGETGVTVKPVCRQCNEGWMSRLEEKSRQILAPLMLGTGEHDFSKEDKAIVVAWILKTWMVFDAASRKQHQMVFSPDERKYLMERLQPQPALNAVMFLARYVGPREMTSDHHWFAVSTRPEPDTAATLDTLNRFYCETMIFGRLAIQATIRRIVADDTEFPVIDRSWLDAQLDITWARGGDHWPPKSALNEERYLEFRDRWLSEELRERRRKVGDVHSMLNRQP
jgi:hypothetical protein